MTLMLHVTPCLAARFPQLLSGSRHVRAMLRTSVERPAAQV
jgi:hypothetical protein